MRWFRVVTDQLVLSRWNHEAVFVRWCLGFFELQVLLVWCSVSFVFFWLHAFVFVFINCPLFYPLALTIFWRITLITFLSTKPISISIAIPPLERNFFFKKKLRILPLLLILHKIVQLSITARKMFFQLFGISKFFYC